MKLGFHVNKPNKTAINAAPPRSYVPWVKCTIAKTTIKTEKNPTIYFLNFGSQIRIPDANCMTPKIFQTVGGILSANEQGGSKNNKNLSAPIIKKRRLQMPTMIFVKFIVFNLVVSC